MTLRHLAWLLVALPATALTARESGAQTVPAPRVAEVTTAPEAPAFGETFRIDVTLRVPPGTSVQMPDTLLTAEEARGVGAGEWRPEPADGDSLDIVASYPAIAFLSGPVVLPAIEVKLRSADGLAVLVLPSDRSATAAPAESRILSLGAVQIAPYAPMESPDSGDVFFPRPAADVLGGDWSTGFRLALTLTLLVAVAVAGSAARRAWAGRGVARAGRVRGRTAREEALRDLERIRAEGAHRDGRIDEFYDATTAVLRTFASRVDPAWVPALTSGELITRIAGRWGTGAAPLRPVIRTAEQVKFGYLRPSADDAEADWCVVRDWIRDASGL